MVLRMTTETSLRKRVPDSLSSVSDDRLNFPRLQAMRTQLAGAGSRFRDSIDFDFRLTAATGWRSTGFRQNKMAADRFAAQLSGSEGCQRQFDFDLRAGRSTDVPTLV